MNRLTVGRGALVAVAALCAVGTLASALLPKADAADVAADNVRYELRTAWGESMGAANVYPLVNGYRGVCGYTASGAPYAARVAIRPGAKPLLYVAGAGRSEALDSMVDIAADAWCDNGEGLAQ